MIGAESSEAKGDTGDEDGCFGKRDYIFGSCAAEEGEGMAIQRLWRGPRGWLMISRWHLQRCLACMCSARTRRAGSKNTLIVAGLVRIDDSALLAEMPSVQAVGTLYGTSLGYIHELAGGLSDIKLPLDCPNESVACIISSRGIGRWRHLRATKQSIAAIACQTAHY